MAESSEQPGGYIVDRLAAVTVEIRRLVGRAQQLGQGPQVLEAMETIVAKLETEPLVWGDPEYATKQAGGDCGTSRYQGYRFLRFDRTAP